MSELNPRSGVPAAAGNSGAAADVRVGGIPATVTLRAKPDHANYVEVVQEIKKLAIVSEGGDFDRDRLVPIKHMDSIKTPVDAFITILKAKDL